MTASNAYATDGKCHNAEAGSYNHECGRSAKWLGTYKNGFTMGFCERCKQRGYEAKTVVKWEAIDA